ncbi:MAG: PIN domain-containing protein [Microbacteriaceae bacterium]|nr:MAG: PIN domain-containing protein [Microbacteriaceae bacterium]
MTLTDAGPLVGLIDADEADHEICRLVLAQLRLPLLTTWPVFTEAMYLLSRAGGQMGQEALWKLTLSGRVEIAELSRAALERSSRLMAKYADLPMDLADATLVALAEERNERLVFTLDSDFEIYRLHGRQRFEIVPRRA